MPSKHCKLLHWFRCMLCEPYTPWKFNIAFENGPFQKEGSLPTMIFQGRTVKLRGWMNQTHKICVFCFTFFLNGNRCVCVICRWESVSWQALNSPIAPKSKAKPQPARASATLGDWCLIKDVGVTSKHCYPIEE